MRTISRRQLLRNGRLQVIDREENDEISRGHRLEQAARRAPREAEEPTEAGGGRDQEQERRTDVEASTKRRGLAVRSIECKSADEGVNDRERLRGGEVPGRVCARSIARSSGRAFSGEIELLKELHNHGVSAWTVDDLAAALRNRLDPLEMRPLFEPGFAADAIDDALWNAGTDRPSACG